MIELFRLLETFYYCYIKRDRIIYAKKLGVRIGKDCEILTNPCTCFGSEPWLVKLGNHVRITAGVKFFTHDGAIWVARGLDSKLSTYDCFKPIIVGNNVMIGARTLIMPGVVIGNNVIIGGGSIVTKDIPSNSIVGGAPARRISDLNRYVSKVKENMVPTKGMSMKEKRKYLMEKRPEWFYEE